MKPGCDDVLMTTILIYFVTVVQDLPSTDGKAREEHRRLATRFRGARLLINHDELRNPLFITASEVSCALFIFAQQHDASPDMKKSSRIASSFLFD